MAVLLTSGCATKKYLSREVGEVNQKVEALSVSVEKTQARTRGNETRIEEVDRKAQAGVNDAKGSAAQALARAADAQSAVRGKLLYPLSMSSDKVTFPFDRAALSTEAKQLVNETVAPIVVENRGVFIEVEGHTDSTGPEAYNHRLGEARAMAVRNYLHDQVGIALHRIEVISYGSSRPVAGNAAPLDRARNRRVVINVLE
jgi:outer membrane protein OmpA-like peptidoglycan-associated protein